jgi:GT2 family glycosyltransferase
MPLLEKLLWSLGCLSVNSHEIIVVDNDSDDGTGQMIAGNFPSIKYMRTEKNLGVAARNLGLSAASGEIVVTLDDDVFGLDVDSMDAIDQLFSRDPALGAVNFRVTNGTDETVCNWVHHCRPELYQDSEFPTYEITEGAVAFRKKALEIAGSYVPYFFISHEGPDLALRLWDNGFKVLYSPRISVKHYHAAENRTTWRRYYFDTRNLFWLVARNLPFVYGFFLLSRGVSAMLLYSVRDGYLLYWLKGVRDGIKGLKQALEDRKVISKQTMDIVKLIDKKRPGFWYLAKKRLFKKGVRI